MTADEFTRTIVHLDLSQAEAARLLGVEARAVRRWVAGDRSVPGPAVQFLKYLIATGKTGAQAIKKLEQ